MLNYLLRRLYPFAFMFVVSCQQVIFVNDRVDTDTDSGHDSSTQADSVSASEYEDTGSEREGGCAPPETEPLVCLDFEQDTDYITHLRDGTLEFVTDNVFDGTTSMKSETMQMESFAYISSTFPSIESGTVFFRLALLVPVGTVTGTIKILNLSAGGNPDNDTERGIDINIASGLSIEIYQHGNQSRYGSTENSVPEGAWFCLRGSYTISETAGETSLWINENLVVSTTASTDSIINGGVSEFSTGIGWTEAGQDTATVYFDNVLVDFMPVSCAM